MDWRHKDLARAALGLRYGNTKKSYRNRFLAAGENMVDWFEMERLGYAERGETTAIGTWFSLTRKGALAALNKGETLCPEDFPVL